MEPYDKMYYKLFNAVADAITALREDRVNLALYKLIGAQLDAEEMFISYEEPAADEQTA